MSKRSEQTTGMPKAGGNKPPQPDASNKRNPRLLGEYKSRHEREAAVQRYVVLGAGIVSALAILLVAIAIISEQFIRPAQAVAAVNGETITVAQFERRVRLERFLIGTQLAQGYARLLSFGMDDQTAQQQLFGTEPFATYLNEMQVSDQLGNRVLDDMIDETLIRQQAAERGITVTSDVVDQQIRDFFGFDPNQFLVTATPSPSPTATSTPFITATPSPIPSATLPPSATPTPDVTPTEGPTAAPTFTAVPSNTPTATVEPTIELATREAEFNTTRQDFFNFIQSTGRVAEADIRSYFETRALRDALRDSITTDLSRTQTFVNVRHILVATEEEALDILQALQAGESFRDLAVAASTDEGSGSNGGELGWGSLTQYVAPFADAARDAEIGALVGPVESEFGWHILQVRGREEREMDDAEFEQSKDRAVSDLISSVREADAANIQRFDTWVDNVPQDPTLQEIFTRTLGGAA